MSQYVVVDLEMCKVSFKRRTNGYHRANETIQVGAVLLNDSFEIIDKFNSFVKPEFGRLSWEISDLTGIKGKDISKAPVMKDVMEAFLDWIPEDTVFVSWSDNDYRQIKGECEAKGIVDPRIDKLLENVMDCQKMFSNKIADKRIYNLTEALIMADIIQEGQEHNGLDDAYNTAKLFAKIMTEPEFKLNRVYENSRSGKNEPLSFSLGDLLGNLIIA